MEVRQLTPKPVLLPDAGPLCHSAGLDLLLVVFSVDTAIPEFCPCWLLLGQLHDCHPRSSLLGFSFLGSIFWFPNLLFCCCPYWGRCHLWKLVQVWNTAQWRGQSPDSPQGARLWSHQAVTCTGSCLSFLLRLQPVTTYCMTQNHTNWLDYYSRGKWVSLDSTPGETFLDLSRSSQAEADLLPF